MRSSLAALVLSAVMISPSGAGATVWVHTKGEDNPFAGGVEQIAIGADAGGYTLGFRCSTATNLAVLFVVPERPQAEHLALMSAMTVQLHVIVDDAEPVTLDASIEVTPDGERYRATAEGAEVGPILRAVAGASRRVAVAAKWADQVIWTRAFKVRGSRKALSPLISGCELP